MFAKIPPGGRQSKPSINRNYLAHVHKKRIGKYETIAKTTSKLVHIRTHWGSIFQSQLGGNDRFNDSCSHQSHLQIDVVPTNVEEVSEPQGADLIGISSVRVDVNQTLHGEDYVIQDDLVRLTKTNVGKRTDIRYSNI